MAAQHQLTHIPGLVQAADEGHVTGAAAREVRVQHRLTAHL